MLAELFSIEHITTFLVLTALETVLGFDNLLYISIESKRVDPKHQAMVRRWGTILAIALRIALLMRALAPMRSRVAMMEVAEGIDAMPREEASYWLGMAVHRRNPRRVLSALRTLLTNVAIKI